VLSVVSNTVGVPGPESRAGQDHSPVTRGIRPSTPADEGAIIELLSQAGLRPNMEPRHMYWKYWQERADWPGSRSFVLARGNELLAHAAVIPGSFASGGRRVRVIHMIDWAARASAPAAGVSLMKYVGRLTDILLAVGGSLQTLRILPHIGFRPYGMVTGYLRPLHPLRLFAGGAPRSWRLPLRFARSAFWALTASSKEVAGWSSRRLGPTEIHAVASVMQSVAGHTTSLERTESLFAYMLDCPIAPMALYAVEKEGRVRGYFLLASAPGQVRIADCRLDTEDPFDWRALLLCAVRQARRYSGAAELAVWASDPLLARCLEDCGFHARGSRTVQVLPSKGFTLPAADLRVQMLDSDAAFHHPGYPSFWA
jgi:hypothetical protein